MFMSMSSDWSHFVICVRALKVRGKAERTHSMIMGKSSECETCALNVITS